MPNALRIWLLPFSILFGAAFVLFSGAFIADVSSAKNAGHIWSLFVHPNAQSAANTLSNAGEIVAAVLAIAITVVAIVVELASNRYTHRITELFVSEPVNFIVMGFFVVTGLQGLWVTMTFDLHTDSSGNVMDTSFVPYWGIALTMLMLTICLLILLPYFAFVFNFLNPMSVVSRIRVHTLDAVRSSRNATVAQVEAMRGVEQLADVALNAMENKDTGISMASLEALCTLTMDYQRMKPALSPEWFRLDGEIARNPDFISMAPEVLNSVATRRIWLEMKVLRQYQTLYNEALNHQRDINYAVAINTRLLGEMALDSKDEEFFALIIKFFNTYLRSTINARDVRTAYNVLNQYRLLAESVLHHGQGERAIEIARYFKYYGRISFDQKQPFILETVAYDLCQLCEIAFDEKSPALKDVLRIFLDIDKESDGDVQESSLRGVRKAQVKLATYFLVKGDEALAREVYRDLSSEKPDRLASIRDELLGVESREFWEVSDRGQNFDYLTPDRKKQMLVFFDWFGATITPHRASVVAASEEMMSDGSPVPSGVGDGK